MRFPIVVCGTINYDNIFKHNKDITPYFRDISCDMGVNFVAQNYYRRFGGTASNISYNLSLMGVSSNLMASVGYDFLEYRYFLNDCGIGTDWIEEFENEPTAQCVTFRDAYENHIDIFYPGPMYNDKNLTLTNKNLEQVQLAVITPTDTISMVIRSKECEALGIPYIIDLGLFLENFTKKDILYCCANAKIFTMNTREFDRFLAHTNLTMAEALKLNKIIIITKGKDGSDLFYKGQEIHIPAVKPHNVLDTVGAGDAYKAGLAIGLINNLPIEICCRIGSVISSFKIESRGAMTHSFTLSDFIERYEQNFKDDRGLLHRLT